MSKKKKNEFKVIYKDEEQIILEEDRKRLIPFLWFFLKYGRIITLIFVSISILTFIFGLTLTISSLKSITPPKIVDSQNTDSEDSEDSNSKNTEPEIVVEFDKTTSEIDLPFSSSTLTQGRANAEFNSRIGSEIATNSSLYVIRTIELANGKLLLFDDNSAIFVYNDTSKMPVYIEKYDDTLIKNNQFINDKWYKSAISKQVTPDGSIVYEFDNNKVLINQNNGYRLADKENVIYDVKGNVIENKDLLGIKTVGKNKILYFANNSAVIVYFNKNKNPIYIKDKNKITINDNNKKIDIEKDAVTSDTISKKTLPNGTIIYEFENGKVLLEKDDDYKLIDKEEIVYDDNGNILIDMDNGLKKLKVKNNSKTKKLNYRLVIEETNNYENEDSISAKYINYKLSVNSNVLPIAKLNNNIWNKGSILNDKEVLSNTTYILYEGEIDKGKSDDFNFGIWFDYDETDSRLQNKWFIGTIKVYAWEE